MHISDLLPFVVSGLVAGAIYGLAGTGLVLTYKTTGIFNFGHGALATVAAYVFYWLRVDQGLDWKLAFVISVLVLGPAMALALERYARVLARQHTSYKIVGTVGLIVFVQGLATLKYGSDPRPFPAFLPGSSRTFHLSGVVISYDQVVIMVVAIAIVGALYALFRFSRLGIAMRAVVDDPDLLDVRGTNPVQVRRVAWLLGSVLAALSGVLVAPLVGLESVFLTFLVVQAFGAAAIGAFSSIPLTFVGGLVVGVIADTSKRYVLDVKWLIGLPASVPFLILFLVLLLLPKRKLLPPNITEARPHVPYKGPPLLRGGTGVVLVALLLFVPSVAGTNLGFFTSALTIMILILSLGLLVKTSGQVSLCHGVFAAVGAVAFSELAVGQGVPWLLALPLAALVAVPVGALIAIPAIRLSGLFLALATFGFAIMAERLFYPLNFMFTSFSVGRPMPRPSFATTDKSFYFVVLAFVVLTALAMIAIHEGRLGRVLRGMSDSPLAVSTMGLSTNVTRVIVFCMSAFIAAISGALYGVSVGSAASSDPRFSSLFSLTLLAVLAISPFREPWYVVPAAAGTILPAYLHGAATTHWLDVAFGFFAIAVALVGGPHVMTPRLRGFLDRVFTVRRTQPAIVAKPPSRERPHHEPPGGSVGLEVVDLTVRFGGLFAIRDLSMSAPLGVITGLIGPNGAGKTTTFDACSGLNRPSTGRISLHGKDVSNLSSAARARHGLGRTFQRMQLCDALTVKDNVSLGREAGQAGARILGQMIAPRHEYRATAAAAAEAMELCGITDLAGREAGELSTGQRRLVELARCLAGPFDVLLLDEPSSGLDNAESEAFGEILRKVVRERNCGMLLVEHDVGLVMRVCEYIYVLDFGRLIFEGAPDAVASSPLVRTAYLGEQADGLEADSDEIVVGELIR